MLSPRNGYPPPEFGFWALGIITSDAAPRQRLLTPHRRQATGYRKLRSVLREAQGRAGRDSGLPAREDARVPLKIGAWCVSRRARRSWKTLSTSVNLKD